MRRITALLASLVLILALAPAATAAPPTTGTWIVMLRAGANPSATARSLVGAAGGELRFVYENAIRGFAFRGSSAAANAMLRNPNVVRIEADATVWLETTQSNATWGLDRIDQRSLPLDHGYTYGPTGDGVTAYVIDSGIRYSHAEFSGRAHFGTDKVGGITPAGSDCNGHGTHVAGTVGGETYGVAKDVELVSVRIFGCGSSSSWSVIIAGIDWVIGDHDAGEPAVANMSLTGPATSSVDTATNNLINDGVAVALAAGNGDFLGRQANACNSSPARVAAAMTTSATQSNDAKVSWANYGDCVDWFAPGVSIVSAGISSDTSIATKSGTSMASPHTAGVAALYLDANPTASPQQVAAAIFANTTKDIVTSSSTANNDLLYSGFIEGTDPEPPANRAPTAVNDTATTDEGQSVTVDVLANDTDPDGDDLTVTGVTQPASGTVNHDGSSVTYTPDSGFFGTDSFGYTISDGRGATAAATVSITVREISEPPPPPDIQLSVSTAKVKGVRTVQLSWSGASGSVDVFRDDLRIGTVSGSSYTDNLGKGGGATFIYRVCEAGTNTCSEDVAASF